MYHAGSQSKEADMKIKRSLLTLLLFFAFLLGACGPSPEQVATMTASAWTPTPVPTNTPPPTPTATPVPYDLTIAVTDTNGSPIAGAHVVFPESGSDKPVMTDDAGRASWTNLNGPNVSLTVTAQGYFKGEQGAALERGPNEVTVALERDPFGLLKAEACAAGEQLLYLEDFQDGEAKDWPQINNLMEGWAIAEYPEEAGNSVAMNNSPDHIGSGLEWAENFQEAVWRVRYSVTGRRGISFNWLQNWGIEFEGQVVDDMRYQIIVGASSNEVHRLILPASNRTVDRGYAVKTPGWHLIEMSLYQGSLQIWIDGVLNMDSTDSAPLPAGGIAIELFPPQEPDTVVYFDDIRVCELSAPFATIYVGP